MPGTTAVADRATAWHRPALLGLLLAVSLTPWAVIVIVLQYASGREVEGGLFLAAFAGALSFVLTGPLSGIVLMRDATRNFRRYCWAFLGVSIPIVSFEAFATPASVMPLLFVTAGAATSNWWLLTLSSAICAMSFYVFYFLILYRLARLGRRLTMFLGAVALSGGSLAIFAFLSHG